MTMLEEALRYAGLGWYIFPVKDDKTPDTLGGLLLHGLNDATTSDAKIKQWWKIHPEANIGLNCGRSGLAVIDLDVDENVNGIESWSSLGIELADACGVIPWISNTPSGGTHLIYRGSIPCTTRKLAPGIDTRGEGGYIVLPPSKTVAGPKSTAGEYKWFSQRIGEAPGPGPIPEQIVELLKRKPTTTATRQSTPNTMTPTLQGFPGGHRDDGTFRAAARDRWENIPRDEAEERARVRAQNSSPPLPENVALAKVESAWKYPPGSSIANHAREVVEAAGVDVKDDLVDKLNALHLTEAGNGEAIALLYGNELRFDHSKGKWLLWSSPVWVEDTTGRVEQLALLMARTRLVAAALERDTDKRPGMLKWGLRSESTYTLSAALHVARTIKGIAVTTEDFDKDAWLLAVANGVLDLTNGKLREGDRKDMMTMKSSVMFDPEATCPRWLRFLEEIFDGDRDLIGFVQRAIGYSMTGDTREQCFFLCYGSGANGKSVFATTINRLLGDYAQVASMATFIAPKYEEAGNVASSDIASLKGARLVAAAEGREGARLEVSRIKVLSGEDPGIRCRFLYRDPFTFVPWLKLWLSANHKPIINEEVEAIWRRVRLIPFLRKFGPGDADPLLAAKLREELPGILNWAIEGCLQWQRQRLGMAHKVQEATAQYRQESDLIGRFLEEKTTPGDTFTVRAGDLYGAYRGWSEGNGDRAMTGTSFGRKLVERGYTKGRDKIGPYYNGLCLNSRDTMHGEDWLSEPPV